MQQSWVNDALFSGTIALVIGSLLPLVATAFAPLITRLWSRHPREITVTIKYGDRSEIAVDFDSQDEKSVRAFLDALKTADAEAGHEE